MLHCRCTPIQHSLGERRGYRAAGAYPAAQRQRFSAENRRAFRKEAEPFAKHSSRPADGGPVPGFGRLRTGAGAGAHTHPHAQRLPLSRGGRVRLGLLPGGRGPPHHRLQPHQPGPGGPAVRGAVCPERAVSAPGGALRLRLRVGRRPPVVLYPPQRGDLLRRQPPDGRGDRGLPQPGPHQPPLLRPLRRRDGHRRRQRHGDRHPEPRQRCSARPAGHPHRQGDGRRPPGHGALRARRHGGEPRAGSPLRLVAGQGPAPGHHSPAGHSGGGRSDPCL